MKSMELQLELFKETEKMFDELNAKKNTMPKKLFKLEEKKILKYTKEQLKLIEKKHPFRKELKELIKKG